MRATILQNIRELQAIPLSQLLEQRYRKLRSVGKYHEDALGSLSAAAAS